jgi:hypothetical protein
MWYTSQSFLSRTNDFLSRTNDFLNRTNDFLSRTNEFLSRTNDFLNRTNDFLNRTNILYRTNNFLSRTNDFLNRTNDFLSRTNDFLNFTNDFLNRTNDFLNRTNDFLSRTNDFLSRTNDFLFFFLLVKMAQIRCRRLERTSVCKCNLDHSIDKPWSSAVWYRIYKILRNDMVKIFIVGIELLNSTGNWLSIIEEHYTIIAWLRGEQSTWLVHLHVLYFINIVLNNAKLYANLFKYFSYKHILLTSTGRTQCVSLQAKRGRPT